MGYRRLFIMRKDLQMSAGKLAAQVGHCAEAYWLRLIQSGLSEDNVNPRKVCFELSAEMVDEYINGAIVKTICEAKNKKSSAESKITGRRNGTD